MERQPLAVFDIDGTLFRSSLLIEMVESMVARNIFTGDARREIDVTHASWANREGTYEAYIRSVISVYQRQIVGCDEQVVKSVVRDTVAAHHRKTYRFTRDLISQLRSAGYYILALSSSPLPMVAEFSRGAGFDAFIGCYCRIEDGVIKEAGEPNDKGLELDIFLETHQSLVTSHGMLAVGDTESDIPLLERAEYRVAFNPNNRLMEHAMDRNWPVIVERKDVIYRIDACRTIRQPVDFRQVLSPSR